MTYSTESAPSRIELAREDAMHAHWVASLDEQFLAEHDADESGRLVSEVEYDAPAEYEIEELAWCADMAEFDWAL